MKPLEIGPFQVLANNEKEARTIAREIFRDENYQLSHVIEPKLIIDAGAHIGLATLWFRLKFPNAKIVSVEPNPENFVLLSQNVAINNLENVDILQMALSGEDGVRKLYIEDDDTVENSRQVPFNSVSSFFSGGWRGDRKQKALEVESVRLAKIIRLLDQPIDLLKLDVEGAEYEILRDISPVADRVQNIICEFHPVKDRKIDDIIYLFKKYKFQYEIAEDLDKRAAKREDRLAIITGWR